MPHNYVSAYGANSITTSTVTVTAAAHAGQKLIFDKADGIVATLPAATGSGNSYEFLVVTSVTSNSYKIQVANSTDVMVGTAVLFQDAGDTVVGFATASTSDTLTMNGTTQGGLLGARAVVTDAKSGVWHVTYVSDASSTEASPFSAAV